MVRTVTSVSAAKAVSIADAAFPAAIASTAVARPKQVGDLAGQRAAHEAAGIYGR